MVLALPASATARNFDAPVSNDPSQQTAAVNPQRADTPNDPGYDRAEPDDEDGVDASTTLYDERYDLFGFPSFHTRTTALYKEGPRNGQPQISGFNAAGAWKLARGRPDVTVAILDTGIRWNRAGLRRRIALNPGELPAGADDNGDGVVTIDELAGTGIDVDAGPDGIDGQLDAQDVLRELSDGTDDDGNGYVDDIAGWDFFDDDNDAYDASSYFAASGHGTGRANEVAEEGNDADGELGVCPRCTVMPIRIWDTFVSDANSFALGIVYAADNGAEVVEGANGSLYHSRFAEAASEYAYNQGLAQVFSGDDLNTGNHNYPANYDHTMLIQGAVPDAIGLGTDFGPEAADFLAETGLPLGSQVPVETYFRGSGLTQYGGHSSIAMVGTSGSENTGKAAGSAALVISAARDRGIALTPDETRVILEQTAEDVTGGATGVDGNVAGVGLPDRAIVGWDMHFGWGRANVGEAVRVARQGGIPPEASIGSPDWYAPLAGASVPITGRAAARHAADGEFNWVLEWAPGLEPADDDFIQVESGESSSPVTSFGTLDLEAVRTAMASYVRPPDPGMPVFSPVSPDPYTGQFTVRLVVQSDGADVPGIDRKVLTVLDDDTLAEGFPKRMGTGGEAPLRYADLDGDNEEELLVPLEDGTLHAYRRDGSEVPGWPVTTGIMDVAASHVADSPGLSDLPPPREPLRGPVIADLEGDGSLEVVTAAGQRVYAWGADGDPVPGFPVRVDTQVCADPAFRTGELRHRKCGFLAGPAVGRFQGEDGPLGIVVPALDGHLYGLRADGTALPGFPVELVDPDVPEGERMFAESINQPAIHDLNGDGVDDVVVATNEVYGVEPPGEDNVAGGFADAFADLLGNVEGGSSRVYAVDGATGEFLDGWPIHLNGGIQVLLPLIGPGHDAAILGGQVVVSTTGGAVGIYDADGQLVRTMDQEARAPGSNATGSAYLNLFEYASVGDLTGSAPGGPAIVKYQVTLEQAANLVLAGQNLPYNHLIGAFEPTTGAPLPNWPRITDDYQFVSASTVAKVADGTSNQVLTGTGLGLLHAYDGVTGLDAAGFPKVTGGWLYAPAALAADGRMAAITREGFLFEWGTEAPACQTEWPAFRHDEQATGNYDRDGTAPGAVEDLAVTDLGANRFRVEFTAPGDDGMCADDPITFVLRVGGQTVDAEFAGSGEPGAKMTGEVEVGPAQRRAAARTFAVHARDEVLNSGAADTVTVGGDDPPGDGGGGTDAGGGPFDAPRTPPPGPGPGPGPGGGTGESAVCARAAALRSASAAPRGRRVSVSFSRTVEAPVTVDVFQQSIGRRITQPRLVARFTGRTRSFTWNGRSNRPGRRVRDGHLFVRYALRLPNGYRPSRRVALRRARGRFSRGPDFHRPDICGLVESFKLLGPVFGGSNRRPLSFGYRVRDRARVSIDVLRGRRVVHRFRPGERPGGRLFRAGLRADRLRRGLYRVRITAQRGREVARVTLAARRL